MKRRFRPGDKVTLTANAVENYGENWANVELTVASVFTFYCSSAKHYNHTRLADCSGHPGFDDSANCALYEMRNGDNFNSAVYDWELE